MQGDIYSVDEGRFNRFPILSPPSTGLTTADTDANGINLLARWSRNRNQDNGWTLQAYFDRNRRHSTEGLFDFAVNTGNIDFQRQSARGSRQQLVYGVGYLLQQIDFRGSSFDNGFSIGPSRLNVQRNVASAFLQDEIKLNRALTFTVGSKFEHNDYTGFEYEPSGRLLWSRSPRHSAWASVSRAVRTPSLLERDMTVTGPFGGTIIAGLPVFLQVASNPSVGSERVIAYETGYRAQATDRLSFDTAAFYNKYDNLVINNTVPGLITLQPGFISFPLQFQNGAKGHSYGVELSTTYEASPRWKLYGAYTYLHINLETSLPTAPLPAITASVAALAGQSPRHQMYVRSSHDLPRHLQLDLIGRYVDRLPGYTPVIPSYVTADVQLAWRPRDKFEFAIVGQNLLDTLHQESPGDPIPVNVRRSVYARATYRW